MIRRLIGVAAVLAICSSIAVPPAVAGDATPDEIYAGAQRAWTAHVPPPHLGYTIAVTVTDHGVVKTRHYQAHADTLDGSVDAQAISDEEHAVDPADARGTRLIAGITSHNHYFNKQLGPRDVDFLGVPQLAPDYTFGVSHRRVRAYAEPELAQASAPTDGGGVQIGRVTAVARRYVVALAGIETIDARPAYHLTLAPVAEPARYRLRDLWVDTATSDVVQLRTEGNFDSPFTRAVPWLITFRGDGEARYIAREVAEGPIRFADSRHYENVSIAFENIAPQRIAPVTLHAAVLAPGLTLLREPEN